MPPGGRHMQCPRPSEASRGCLALLLFFCGKTRSIVQEPSNNVRTHSESRDGWVTTTHEALHCQASQGSGVVASGPCPRVANGPDSQLLSIHM